VARRARKERALCAGRVRVSVARARNSQFDEFACGFVSKGPGEDETNGLLGQDTNCPISRPAVGARLSRPEPPRACASHTKPSTGCRLKAVTVSRYLNPSTRRRRLASEARVTRRRKIVTQAIGNKPSRPKMAPASIGSAVAPAATRRAARRPARREANMRRPRRQTARASCHEIRPDLCPHRERSVAIQRS